MISPERFALPPGIVPLPGRPRGRRYPACLGPLPEESLFCLVDLGLTDLDIALYFDLDLMRVAALTLPLRARAA